MNQPLISLSLLATLAGCPSDDANPAVLWLAPIPPDELRVQLSGEEPRPY